MSVRQWFETELKHSKTNQSDISWGRKVITAIDKDDCVNLAKLMDKKYYPNGDINTRTTVNGYDGYIWTVSIHKFLGDTALHYCLKQSKLYCLYMLLWLDADLTLANDNNEIPTEMIKEIYQTTAANMKYDAKRKILNHIPIHEFNRLPKGFHCSKVEDEAWRMIHQGRILYTELPKSLQPLNKPMYERIQVNSRTRNTLSFNDQSKIAKLIQNQSFLPTSSENAGEINSTTEAESVNQEADTTAHHPEENPNIFREKRRSQWIKRNTEDGYIYFMHRETGESTWHRPEDYIDESSTEPSKHSLESKQASQLSRRRQRRRKGNRSSSHSYGGEESIDEGSQQSIPEDQPVLYEDVWTKDTLDDILDLIEKQKRHFYAKILPPAAYTARGLSLLSSVKFGNSALEKASIKEKQILQEGRSDVLAQHLPSVINVSELQAKMNMFSFIKDLSYFQKLIQSTEAINHMSSTGEAASSKVNDPLLQNPALRYSATLSDKILFQDQFQQQQQFQTEAMTQLSPTKAKKLRKELDILSPSYKLFPESGGGGGNLASSFSSLPSLKGRETNQPKYLLDDQPPTTAVATAAEGSVPYFREIFLFSTYSNMKYLRIGNLGAYDLADTLYNDPIIVQLTLAHARISDEGMIALAQSLPTMHRLKYLDLSSNACTDLAAIELSNAVYDHKTLRVLSLAGNRIGLKGICHLASAIISSHVNLHEAQRLADEGKEQSSSFGASLKIERSSIIGRLPDQSKRQKENRIIWCSVKNNALQENRKARETLLKLFEEYEFEFTYQRKTQSMIFQQRKQQLFHSIERIIPLPEKSISLVSAGVGAGEEEEDDEFAFEGSEDRQREDAAPREGEEGEREIGEGLMEPSQTSLDRSTVTFSLHDSSLQEAPPLVATTTTVEEEEGRSERTSRKAGQSLKGVGISKKTTTFKIEEEEELSEEDEEVDALSEMTDLESIDKRQYLYFIA